MARLSDKNKQPKPAKQFQTQRELFYATPIFYKDLENAKELNTYLLKHIKKWKKEDEKGIVRSNSLGWHSVDRPTEKNIILQKNYLKCNKRYIKQRVIILIQN